MKPKKARHSGSSAPDRVVDDHETRSRVLLIVARNGPMYLGWPAPRMRVRADC
jgi:hypothetical protein